MTKQLKNNERSWFEEIETEPVDLVGKGKKFIFGALGVFVVWALLAPLGSAIVAQGIAVSQGKNKVLQHRNGGVVLAILAKEGDHVKAGQVLFRLDPASDQAELTRLRAKQSTLLALKTRLEAEKNYSFDQPEGSFSNFQLRGVSSFQLRGVSSGVFTSLANAGFRGNGNEHFEIVNAVLQEQAREFETGRQAVRAELDALSQKSLALEKRKDGLRRRIVSVTKQVSILRKQHSSAQSLARGGHIARQQSWEIENRLLASKSELAAMKSEYSSATNGIEEVGAQIDRVRHSDEKNTSSRLTEVLGELGEIRDQYIAVKTAVENTEIKAPTDGILLRSALTTVGGVAKPGEILGEIVPHGAELEMRVRIQPQDISEVWVGQKAEIKITALNPRIFDALIGTVSFIAADATTDPTTMQQYFSVNVQFDEALKTPRGTPLVTSGMNGDVFLKRKSWTFASYLLAPLTESFSHAFTEK